MTGLSSVLHFYICLPLWQATSSLSPGPVGLQDNLTPFLDSSTFLQRRERTASGDLSHYEGFIEISFPDPSLEAEIRRYLENLDIYTPLLDTTEVTHADIVQASTDMTISPSNLFQGDTVTINCTFNELGIISWYVNSVNVSDSQKYSTASSWQGSKVIYTMKIKNVTNADTGNYTCSLNVNGTEQTQSKIIDTIKTLQLNSSNDMDAFTDNSAFNLTCCSDDIREFAVTWTVNGPAGIAAKTATNGICSTYMLAPDVTEFRPFVTSYTCTFQRLEGARASKVIKVTYYKRAIITIPSSLKISASKNLDVNCQTDISVTKIAWAKTTTSNIVADNSILQKFGVTSSWTGTYFCIAYQGSLMTYANLSLIIIPLPFLEEITVYPLQTYLTSCENTAIIKLTCCVKGFNYTRNFTHGSPPSPESNVNCSSTSIIFDCNTERPASVSCVIFNILKDNVTSGAVTISYVRATPEQGRNCKAQDGLPETYSGKPYVVPCQTIDNTLFGTITFSCNDGEWSKPVDDCYSRKIFQELLNVQNVLSGAQDQQTLSELLTNITVIATSEKETILNSSKTLELMVQVISLLANTTVAVDKSMMQNFMKIVDVVLDRPSAWDRVAGQSVTILNSVESFIKRLDFNDTVGYKVNNLQLFGQTMDQFTDYSATFSLGTLTGSVSIEKIVWSGRYTKVVTVSYATIKDIVPKETRRNKTINGLVMSTVIGKNSSIDMANKFTIKMSFAKSNTTLIKPECVWYDFAQTIWNNNGCNTTEENGLVVCSCNHLTSFSILMVPVEKLFLDIITYAGVGISLACLVITLVIEAIVWTSVIKNKTSYVRHVCLVNIAVTLLVADIWFIIGAALEKEKGSAACKTAAFFSFYFYLSLFFWMLTTGLILFYRMVYILHDMSRKTMMIIAFLLGYGCPLLITTVTLASTEPSNTFISNNFCWLNSGDPKPFLAFVVPALTIVFINFLILMVVIFKLMRPTVGENPGQEERKVLIVIAKTTAILTPLLGTTWGFGLGVLANPTNDVIHGIFAALNSLQGLFILISTVLLDQKVRMAVRSSISASYWRTLRSRVQATSTDSSGSSQPRSKPRKTPFKTKLYGRNATNEFTVQDSSETSRASNSMLI